MTSKAAFMNSIRAYIKTLMARPLIAGTAILTLTGFVSRLIGFFYRIYLSRTFGEENLGIYQLISPVIALSFAATAAGYQTAVSKMTAELAAKWKPINNGVIRRPFWVSVGISLPLSLLCTILTYTLAVPMGTYLLREPRTIPLLRVISFSFPFVGIHACINGWFYGMKKAGLPSLAQIVEQLTRVGCVFFLTYPSIADGKTPDVKAAVFGLAFGELVSMTVAIMTFLPYFKPAGEDTFPQERPDSWRLVTKSLLSMVLPLTANRLVLNFLGSAESVAIPEMLRRHGYTTEMALSVFGVLTGMALPLIFFPNAITGSIAVMLLPMISENYCLGKLSAVRRLTLQTLKYSLCLGITFLAVFVLFGPFLGRFLFHSSFAGRCIRTLGWICPFLYLDVTLSSILQGLGMAGRIFMINVLSLSLRLAFVYLAVPRFGLSGYLWGMLAGQLLLTALYGASLYHFLQKK